MERWKPYPHATEYEVSTAGRVRRNGRVLKPRRFKNGYLNVHIKGDQKYVHRLVFETWGGAIRQGYHINHKNQKRDCNTIDNLEMITPKQNAIHARHPDWWRQQTEIYFK